VTVSTAWEKIKIKIKRKKEYSKKG
jgi:hypothetical protein